MDSAVPDPTDEAGGDIKVLLNALTAMQSYFIRDG